MKWYLFSFSRRNDDVFLFLCKVFAQLIYTYRCFPQLLKPNIHLYSHNIDVCLSLGVDGFVAIKER